MRKLLTNFNDRERVLSSHRVYDPIFNSQELGTIRQYCASLPTETAGIGSQGAVVPQTRQGTRAFINVNHENQWIFQRIFNTTADANNRHWGFELWGCNQIQYTVYNPSGDHYTWHTDSFFDQVYQDQRKLTVIVPLVDPSEYQGGEFQINVGAVHTVNQAAGSVIMMPSFVLHRVTPVTQGTRTSLVLWFVGPKFS